MGQTLPNKVPIGIVAPGNLLHGKYKFDAAFMHDLSEIIPADIDVIDSNDLGMKLLSFLENKERLIVIDPVDANELSAAEILYWSHNVGTIPKEIVTIHTDAAHNIIDELIKYFTIWGVYPVETKQSH